MATVETPTVSQAEREMQAQNRNGIRKAPGYPLKRNTFDAWLEWRQTMSTQARDYDYSLNKIGHAGYMLPETADQKLYSWIHRSLATVPAGT